MSNYLKNGYYCYYFLIDPKFILFSYQLFLVKQIIGYYGNFLKVKQESYLTNFW
jgi:hypothetical protein